MRAKRIRGRLATEIGESHLEALRREAELERRPLAEVARYVLEQAIEAYAEVGWDPDRRLRVRVGPDARPEEPWHHETPSGDEAGRILAFPPVE